MKKLDSKSIDKLEELGISRGTWVILAVSYGKYRPAERISFYEYMDNFYSVIYRGGSRGKTIAYKYDSRNEGNVHFNKIKIEMAVIGNLFLQDKRSL